MRWGKERSCGDLGRVHGLRPFSVYNLFRRLMPMPPRRPLGETLAPIESTPEERAFLRGDEKKVHDLVATKRSRADGASRPARRKRRKAFPSPVAALEDEPCDQTTFGFPRPLLNALRRASLERKIARTAPFTQQDIVSELLRDWLSREGFWPPVHENGE